MPERIVSPGVFTSEKDLSFLPQGVADIGAAIIGPTQKGPAFVPTTISNFSEFEEMFGNLDKRYYTPYTVQQYLRSAGTVTVVRILGVGGALPDIINLKGTTAKGETRTLATLAPSRGGASGKGDLTLSTGSGNWSSYSLTVDGSDISAYTKNISFNTSSADYIGKVFSRDPQVYKEGSTTVPVYLYKEFKGFASHTGSGGWAAGSGPNNAATGSFSFARGGGSGDAFGATAAASDIIEIGMSGVKVRLTSYTADADNNTDNDPSDDFPNFYYLNQATETAMVAEVVSKINTLFPDALTARVDSTATTMQLSASEAGTGGNSFTMTTGSTADGLNSSVTLTLAGGLNNASNVTLENSTLDFNSGASAYDSEGNASSWTGNVPYSTARTPYLASQMMAGIRYNLFRVYTRSHGTDMNSKFRVGISNVKAAGSVAGSDYGSFTLSLFRHNPGQQDDGTPEDGWDDLSFDPESPNYFARRIGDRHVTIDSNGKLTYLGEWPNMSKHIRVGDYKALQGQPKTVVPMGHAGILQPVKNSPTASYIASQENTTTNEFDSNIYYGFDFAKATYDNLEYLSPIPFEVGPGANVSMSLENMLGHADASSLGDTYSNATSPITLSGSAIQQRKFVVPFQWGWDGDIPGNPKHTGTSISATNTQGYDCSTALMSGSIAYRRAINAVSNPDEFDINLLATPGVIHRLHPKVTNHAISKIEARADAFYVLDTAAISDSIATTTNTVSAMDTNYAATYYPWVKIVDSDTNLPVWVPPSVVLPGVIAFTDKVAHEWFAPAGLNRGGLTTVLEAKTRLTHAERDQLYEDRVNPIATFPGQGVVVFGQKTLQAKPSALDRINVRRLLIALKKFIASASRYLVFEQNTVATRNRFLNIVNPYLESVQSNSGLSAFRVVMDDTNNTPDVVDRNRLVGQIFIQPTRTAEFIVLDFVVQPTGASFPE